MSRSFGSSPILPGALWLTLAASALVHGLGFLAVDFMPPEAALPMPALKAQLIEAPAPVPAATTQQQPPRARKSAATTPVLITDPASTEAPVILGSVRGAPVSPLPPAAPNIEASPKTEPVVVAAAEPTTLPAIVRKPAHSMPARIRLSYELKSSLVDGRADIQWRKTADQSYVIDGSIEANGFFATMFAGRLEQESRGTLTANGIRPEHFSLRRGDTPAEFAEFKWGNKEIRHQRTRGEHLQPLGPNGQDLLSFLFQFGFEFDKPVSPKQIAFTITNARKMDLYEFQVVGVEKLVLPIGEVETIHVTRNTGDPADTYDAWLAPSKNYLPVKLMFKLGGRVQVEQLATSLTIDP